MIGVELHGNTVTIDVRSAPADAVAFLATLENVERLELVRCHGKLDLIEQLIRAVLDQIHALHLDHVWFEFPVGFEELGGIQLATEDATPECSAMFARLPPRPAALVTLELPDGVVLPPSWRR